MASRSIHLLMNAEKALKIIDLELKNWGKFHFPFFLFLSAQPREAPIFNRFIKRLARMAASCIAKNRKSGAVLGQR